MSTSRCRDDRGFVIPLVALLLPVVILMTAFAVDLGRQRSSRRTMQAARRRHRPRHGPPGRRPRRLHDLQRPSDRRSRRSGVGRPQRHPPRCQIIEVVSGGLRPHHRRIVAVQAAPPAQFSPANDPTLIPDAVKIVTSETTDYFFQPGPARSPEPPWPRSRARSISRWARWPRGSRPRSRGEPRGSTATVNALNAGSGPASGITVPTPGSGGIDRGRAIKAWRPPTSTSGSWRQTGGLRLANEILARSMTVGQCFDATATALEDCRPRTITPTQPTAPLQVPPLPASTQGGARQHPHHPPRRRRSTSSRAGTTRRPRIHQGARPPHRRPLRSSNGKNFCQLPVQRRRIPDVAGSPTSSSTRSPPSLGYGLRVGRVVENNQVRLPGDPSRSPRCRDEHEPYDSPHRRGRDRDRHGKATRCGDPPATGRRTSMSSPPARREARDRHQRPRPRNFTVAVSAQAGLVVGELQPHAGRDVCSSVNPPPLHHQAPSPPAPTPPSAERAIRSSPSRLTCRPTRPSGRWAGSAPQHRYPAHQPPPSEVGLSGLSGLGACATWRASSTTCSTTSTPPSSDRCCGRAA